MPERFKILSVSDLFDGAFSASISLKLYDHGRVALIKRDECHIREAFSGRHLFDDRITFQSIDISQVNCTLQSILVIVAAIAGNMNVRNIKRSSDGVFIPVPGVMKQLF